MRAISLWQPYASLIAVGAKQYETRSWATAFRGYVAIHAAKRWTAEEKTICWELKKDFSVSTQECLQYWPTVPLPLGAVLCVVKLIDVHKTEDVVDGLTVSERAFGNYQPERFAWELEVVEVFAEPIPAKGAQGFFRWDKPA